MQHDLVVDNNDGYDVRIDINEALQALGTGMLGTTAPSTPYSCEMWNDQSTGKVWKRNSANTAWLQFGKLDAVKVADIPAGGTSGQALIKNSNVDGDVGWGATGLPASGGNISGNLTVAGTLGVTGATTHTGRVNVTAGDLGIILSAASGQWCRYRSQNARAWDFGSDLNGNFEIDDDTVGAARFLIDTNGNTTIYQSLTVGVNMVANGAVISNYGDGGIQLLGAQGGHARFLSQVNNVRQWRFGCEAGGSFDISDISAGAVRMTIDINGFTTFAGALQTVAADGLWINAPNGTTARLRCIVTGTREWDVGCASDGTFGFWDASGGVLPMYILAGGGGATFNYPTNQLGQGIKYGTYANVNVAFRWASLSNFALFINGSNVGTVYMQASDERLKKNVKAAEGNALAELGKLKLISFDLPDPSDAKAKPAHVTMGFSAQQVRGVIPESVTGAPRQAIDPERDLTKKPLTEDEIQLSLAHGPLLARCVGAIQQLSAKVEALEAKIAGLAVA